MLKTRCEITLQEINGKAIPVGYVPLAVETDWLAHRGYVILKLSPELLRRLSEAAATTPEGPTTVTIAVVADDLSSAITRCR